MRRSGWILCLLLTALSAASCRRAVERAAAKVRFEGIERVERRGLTGVEAVLRVANGSGYGLELDAARADIYYGASRVGDIRLCEGVRVPRRTTMSVATQWQLRIADPLALYMVARRLRSGDMSQIAVSYDVSGRGGPAPVNISGDRVPLSDFLNIFGLTLQDVATYLDPKR